MVQMQTCLSLNACFSELFALLAVWFLYSVLVSSLQRREWAVCRHISLPPEPLSQSALWVITKLWAELPVGSGRFPPALCFIHGSVCMSAICRDVDGPRVSHSKWSKSEREKQILCINVYMWNLEKRYRWIYLQSRNRCFSGTLLLFWWSSACW